MTKAELIAKLSKVIPDNIDDITFATVTWYDDDFIVHYWDSNDDVEGE